MDTARGRFVSRQDAQKATIRGRKKKVLQKEDLGILTGFTWFLTFWCRNYFFNFSTPCIKNVNNTDTKQVRIMKQTAF